MSQQVAQLISERGECIGAQWQRRAVDFSIAGREFRHQRRVIERTEQRLGTRGRLLVGIDEPEFLFESNSRRPLIEASLIEPAREHVGFVTQARRKDRDVVLTKAAVTDLLPHCWCVRSIWCWPSVSSSSESGTAGICSMSIDCKAGACWLIDQRDE